MNEERSIVYHHHPHHHQHNLSSLSSSQFIVIITIIIIITIYHHHHHHRVISHPSAAVQTKALGICQEFKGSLSQKNGRAHRDNKVPEGGSIPDCGKTAGKSILLCPGSHSWRFLSLNSDPERQLRSLGSFPAHPNCPGALRPSGTPKKGLENKGPAAGTSDSHPSQSMGMESAPRNSYPPKNMEIKH